MQAIAPWLLELPGMGPISAGRVLVSRSHAGRLRSEAAFAALAGVSPIPASSGDRRLNRALHTVALVRLRDDPTTRAHAARRRAEGRSPGEIRRRVKRAVARHLFKLLCRYDRPEVVRIFSGRHTSAVAGGRSCDDVRHVGFGRGRRAAGAGCGGSHRVRARPGH